MSDVAPETAERVFIDKDMPDCSISVELSSDGGITILGMDANPWYYGASGVGATLTPQTARELAAHLNALADKLEGKA